MITEIKPKGPRTFYIDTGNMPPQKAKKYLEKIQKELKQRKLKEIK